MSAVRRAAVPIAAGVGAAVAAFAIVLLATRSDDDGAKAAATRARTATQAPAAAAAGAPDTAGGRLVFARMGCGSCHRLEAAGSRGQIGPPLDQVLANHDRASLLAKIVRPGKGSVMPQDF